MPTYGYECLSCNERFETIQRNTEYALKVHENCGGKLRRLLYPVGIIFKGSGFYVNDYAKKSGPDAKSDGTSDAKTDTKSESTSEVKAEGKVETKAEAKAETKAESTSESKADAKPAAPAAT
jgi:putative FmdB family regulatory protein